MTSTVRSFEQLTFAATNVLIRKLKRSQGTARHYRVLWRKIKSFMDANEIVRFDPSVGKSFLLFQFGKQDFEQLSKSQKDLIRAVNVLSEFVATGSIRPIKETPVFEGSIGRLMLQYISHRYSLRLKASTIEEGSRHLFRFLCFLNQEKAASIHELSQQHILRFIKTIDLKYVTLVHRALETLRGFFRFLYNHEVTTSDLSVMVPRDKFIKQPQLPSTYTEQEITQVIASVDRGNATGKRNYAIVLLAARLGLRASDIANLKFENLNWEHGLIALHQYKTGKDLQLPLLTEIGDAIIDYMKYGRPKSQEPFVFLVANSPYQPICRGAITGIVHSYFVKSGVNFAHRKHGAHALRHSLAGLLLEKQTVLPVISEILGHRSSASTSYYIRIDVSSMRQCVLDVPVVHSSFYNQKGGYFYE